MTAVYAQLRRGVDKREPRQLSHSPPDKQTYVFAR